MSQLLEGKIVHINRDKHIVHIEGADGVKYQADKKAIEAIDLDQLNEGDRLTFIPADKKGQPKVHQICELLGAAGSSKYHNVSLPEPPNYRQGPNEFNNPYAFVRSVRPAEGREADFKQAFVSHHRYSGLSGVITCRLKTLSPFFTPDTRTIVEEKTGPEKGHKRMDYFSTSPSTFGVRTPAIPGSTLRGAIRSICEAVSNSTFSAVSLEKLNRRSLPGEANQLCAGRVIKLPDGNDPGEIQLLKSVKLPFTVLDEAGGWAKDGIEAWAELGKNSITKLHQQKPESDDAKHGYLKLTGRDIIANDRGISLKHNERFFYQADEAAIKFSMEEKRAYDDLIGEQRERARRQVDSQENAAVARTILARENHPLKVGYLVYFQEETIRNDQTGESERWAFDLGYVSIPRRRYQRRVVDLLDPFFQPSSDSEQLCLASRLFGFVRDGQLHPQREQDKSSYAGRVYFSDAEFAGEQVKYASNVTLEILSSPKPTSCEFYLANQTDPSQVWVYGTPAYHRHYDDPAMSLRGRKFYWHQKDIGQYRWQDREEVKERNSQNSTVRLLAADNEFKFTVRFENLEAHELGMLLWSLALEDGLEHKIGMGKPIGLGSVNISIEELRLIDRNCRYQQLFLPKSGSFQTGSNVAPDWNGEYVSKFKEWMQEVFGRKFDELENVSDLRVILNYPANSQRTTHYPLLPGTNSKSFEWFRENRRPEVINNQDAQILPPSSSIAGLPDRLTRTVSTEE